MPPGPRTMAVISTRTDVTPGSEDTTCSHCFLSRSFTGQAGVVSSTLKATSPPFTWRSFTKPSATMSWWRSGSWTARSAWRTASWVGGIRGLRGRSPERTEAAAGAGPWAGVSGRADRLAGEPEHGVHALLDAGGHVADRGPEHVGRRRDDALLLVHDEGVHGAVAVARAAGLELLRGTRVVPHGEGRP